MPFTYSSSRYLFIFCFFECASRPEHSLCLLLQYLYPLLNSLDIFSQVYSFAVSIIGGQIEPFPYFHPCACVQVLAWWESLTLIEKRVPANKTKLVKTVEATIQAQATVFQGGGSGGGDDEGSEEEKK